MQQGKSPLLRHGHNAAPNSSNSYDRGKSTRQPFRLGFAETDVPQLFCQLDVLRRSEEESEYAYWKEKARWVRFEEIAESVLGRWSKPHVATLMQTSLLDLKSLLNSGVILLNIQPADLSSLSQTIAQALIDNRYINDPNNAQKLSWIFGLPHFHHHEKRSVSKTASSVSLSKQGLHPSPSFIINNLSRRDDDSDITQDMSGTRLVSKPSTNDMIGSEHGGETTNSSQPSIKDYNTKLQRKLSRKTEGASILICPVNFVKEQTIVFVRLENAMELLGMLEIKLYSRFIVLLIGPEESEKQLLQIGRAMATILTDDICREFAYMAQDSNAIKEMIDRFMQDTYVIPPSEWDPTIRIEPPLKYMSKEQRQAQEPDVKTGQVEEIDLTPHADPNLKGSKRPFYGLYVDIRNKLPFYLSDFLDALSLQCVAATLYLYLACLCSVIAFGGMLGTATDNYMATMECILAASASGVLYALLSGQPLNILSATGPMLILERILRNMCKDYHLDFLEFRLWIGIWVFVLLFIFVIFNLSFLVKYITRFTEDCFASLVSLIFIMDAIRELLKLRLTYPINYEANLPLDYSCSCLFNQTKGFNQTIFNDTNIIDSLINGTSLNKSLQMYCVQKAGGILSGTGCSTPVYRPDIFFFSVLLFIFTFVICMGLQEFRTSTFFPTKIRTILGDFAVLIAIVLMSAWNAYLRLDTPKLHVPTEFKPTRPHDRGWFIPLFGKNPIWTVAAAIVPALIATILIFMDQQITAVIINRKEFKLKKKLGYHLDLLILSITILLQSLLGLPWFVAATVLALTHVNALKIMSENTAPGEKPKFEGILEQRVSALLMSILTGLSVFFTKVLGFIPMPVLYAVFMYMGVAALRNMQIFHRVLLIFMPQKHQPDHPYLRHVRITRVHLFTCIQLISLGGMFAVKSVKSIAIGFPVLVLATCFVRKLMDKIFTQEELFWLDDVLPGTKIGRIRRLSAARNVHMLKPTDDDNDDIATPPIDRLDDRVDNKLYQDLTGNNLRSIAEEIHQPPDKEDYMYNGFTMKECDQTRTPLIVVTEALPSEETAQDTNEEAEHLMHRDLSSEQYSDKNDELKHKIGSTSV